MDEGIVDKHFIFQISYIKHHMSNILHHTSVRYHVSHILYHHVDTWYNGRNEILDPYGPIWTLTMLYAQAQNLAAYPAAPLFLEGTNKSRLLNEPWLFCLLLAFFFLFFCILLLYIAAIVVIMLLVFTSVVSVVSGGVVPLCGVAEADDVNAWNKEQLDLELNKCDLHQRIAGSCFRDVRSWLLVLDVSMIQHWGLCVLQEIWTGDAHMLLIWRICTEKRLICLKERLKNEDISYISRFILASSKIWAPRCSFDERDKWRSKHEASLLDYSTPFQVAFRQIPPRGFVEMERLYLWFKYAWYP